MKIQGIEIILDGALPTDELVGYVERAKEKHGDRIVQMSVKVDGEFVELDYTIQPIRFERIRRITGYLQETGQWNNAKRAEEHDRVKHGMANQCVACGAEMPEGDQVCAACRDGSSKSAITKITTIAEFLGNLGEKQMAAELAGAAQALKGERA